MANLIQNESSERKADTLRLEERLQDMSDRLSRVEGAFLGVEGLRADISQGRGAGSQTRRSVKEEAIGE